jgi:hypothetical protein
MGKPKLTRLLSTSSSPELAGEKIEKIGNEVDREVFPGIVRTIGV